MGLSFDLADMPNARLGGEQLDYKARYALNSQHQLLACRIIRESRWAILEARVLCKSLLQVLLIAQPQDERERDGLAEDGLRQAGQIASKFTHCRADQGEVPGTAPRDRRATEEC
jgi:hypothetical protein